MRTCVVLLLLLFAVCCFKLLSLSFSLFVSLAYAYTVLNTIDLFERRINAVRFFLSFAFCDTHTHTNTIIYLCIQNIYYPTKKKNNKVRRQKCDGGVKDKEFKKPTLQMKTIKNNFFLWQCVISLFTKKKNDK